MKFLSIYNTVERNTPPTPEHQAAMGRLILEGTQAGYLLAVEGCMPSALGARVRMNGGTLTVKVGPFTESKELVGSLAIIQADSRAEAVAHIKNFLRIAGDGECELRQLYEAPATAKP